MTSNPIDIAELRRRYSSFNAMFPVPQIVCDIRALLDEVERLRALVKKLEDDIRDPFF